MLTEKLTNACCKACDANSVYNERSETLIYSLTQGVASFSLSWLSVEFK